MKPRPRSGSRHGTPGSRRARRSSPRNSRPRIDATGVRRRATPAEVAASSASPTSDSTVFLIVVAIALGLVVIGIMVYMAIWNHQVRNAKSVRLQMVKAPL